VKALDLESVDWRKSTHSGDTGGDCVEVADVSSAVAVRDSKYPDGPVLLFGRNVFGGLVWGIGGGRKKR
jgi:hypothetical protein